MFTNILFPVDFSEASRQMAPWIASIAARTEATVTVLHILDLSPGVFRQARGYLIVEDITSLRSQAEQNLRTALSSHFCEVPLSFCIGEGHPGNTIAKHVAENQIDLVCMPTYGCGRFRHLLLGSVTANFLDSVDVPVLTCAHHKRPARRRADGFKRVLCCVDLSRDSIQITGWAARVSRQFRAELALVHALPAVDEPTTNRGVRKANSYHKARARRLYEQLRSELEADCDLHLAGGSVAHSIRQTAIERRSDLILIGRGVMHKRLGRMRTNTYAIIRESPVRFSAFRAREITSLSSRNGP